MSVERTAAGRGRLQTVKWEYNGRQGWRENAGRDDHVRTVCRGKTQSALVLIFEHPPPKKKNQA